MDNLLYNIDTLSFTVRPLDFSLFIALYEKDLEETFQVARSTRSNAFIELAGVAFEMLPASHKNYRYVLHNESYELRIAREYDEDFDFSYPVYMTIRSAELWVNGYAKAYDKAFKFLSSMFDIVATKISRLDHAIHINRAIDIDISPGIDTVCRTNIRHVWYDKSDITGYQFGKSPILLRIYDKHKELLVSLKTWFSKIWLENGFDVDKPIWNIEFQLRRQFFVDRHIDTVEDALLALPEIHTYLTHKWFRVVVRDKKQKCVSRLKTVDWWQEVQQVFDNCTFRELKEKSKIPDSDHIFQTMQGYLISYAAFTDSQTIDEFILNLTVDIKKMEAKKRTTFSRLALERRSLYE
ncbi:hypothetical protein ACLGL1_04515 [Peptococcus simiae]|uniref:hypothetical protein n=1 Tax=Peptococcus simiae TaxID=1643805 RepID=UPI00397F48A7